MRWLWIWMILGALVSCGPNASEEASMDDSSEDFFGSSIFEDNNFDDPLVLDFQPTEELEENIAEETPDLSDALLEENEALADKVESALEAEPLEIKPVDTKELALEEDPNLLLEKLSDVEVEEAAQDEAN